MITDRDSQSLEGRVERAFLGLARLILAVLLAVFVLSPSAWAASDATVQEYDDAVQPILVESCYACHGEGMKKGKVALDEASLDDRELWWSVLKNVRAGIMPPPGRPRPTAEQVRALENWVKHGVFGTDPNDPDPGRVTLRRLNRVEYRNTVRDLLGIDYRTDEEFPADDTGYGFDNIGDVLTVSPLLLEKYMAAAETIVARALPASEHGKRSKQSERFFFRDDPGPGPERTRYAREVLARFTSKAFRRPSDDRTIDRLLAIAEEVYREPGKSVEQGVAQAMVAVLASPRFLFRVEEVEPNGPDRRFPLVDEYALASRLSYFLWSTMPDDELFRLAEKRELRPNLAAQVQRLLDDPRSNMFVENFTGQWLQARDVEGTSIDARTVLARDSGDEKQLKRDIEEFKAFLAQQEAASKQPGKATPANPPARPKFFNRPRIRLDGDLRNAMKRETELFFSGVVHENRSVLDLLDSDYTFLNEKLAAHYGIPGVKGNAMRRVTLAEDSPRGGLLTQGTVLVVTSNPTRTSPVKRGLFILDNLLGTPPPPQPPDIGSLEESEKAFGDREPTLREVLAQHQNKPLCSSCHSRMDPLGLALENFNAMGMWREKERNQPLDTAGKLITGESFNGIRDLKRVLKENHRTDFYRCLTEKTLTYALGRGLEASDVETVDSIVDRLDRDGGRFSALLIGIIESAPFQKRRSESLTTTAAGPTFPNETKPIP